MSEPLDPVPLPCPFCGKDAMTFEADTFYRLQLRCDNCLATGPTLGRNRHELTELWNKRVRQRNPECHDCGMQLLVDSNSGLCAQCEQQDIALKEEIKEE